MEGLTVEGQMQYDRHERVNFEREQRKIFKLYRRTNVLQWRRALEQRVMQPFGFFFLDKLYRIFVYHTIRLRSGLKLIEKELIFVSLF